MSILNDAADYFKRRETAVQRWYSDDVGRYAFRVTVHDRDMIVTAKKYLDGSVASFFAAKIVQRAIDTDALILLIVPRGGYRLLFDPRTVKEVGEENTEKVERKRRGETWIDVRTDIAADLRDWVDGDDSPASPADLKDRPHDIREWSDDDG